MLMDGNFTNALKKAKTVQEFLSIIDEAESAKDAAGEKKVEMIHVKDLLGLTGYIRGGCSPIGMKKKYPTIIDETAILFDRIYVSAGQRGIQVILDPQDLAGLIDAEFKEITR